MRYERKVAKLCHYILYGITFTSLLVLCYFLYMDEAIKQSKIRATTLIKRPEEYELELPTITICPEPGFKPSISQMYNLSKPARQFCFGIKKLVMALAPIKLSKVFKTRNIYRKLFC